MSSLFFLLEVIGFVFLAYWTYTNDQLGPKGGSKGLLRMNDIQIKGLEAPRKRVPKWRRDHREEPATAASRTWRASPAEGQPPAWKRRVG